jgi:hypothetical protein
MQNQRSHITTENFASEVGVKPQSVRVRLCRTGSYYGIRPVKLPSGRLMWPADGPARIIHGEAA